jgi:hypothetical protein
MAPTREGLEAPLGAEGPVPSGTRHHPVSVFASSQDGGLAREPGDPRMNLPIPPVEQWFVPMIVGGVLREWVFVFFQKRPPSDATTATVAGVISLAIWAILVFAWRGITA